MNAGLERRGRALDRPVERRRRLVPYTAITLLLQRDIGIACVTNLPDQVFRRATSSRLR